ncbi:MAG TPA: hypothetical protein VFA26_11965, partial [Gemmataceae bacterium]|nr:hypothetical protein [Gemmataceae bacterium]
MFRRFKRFSAPSIVFLMLLAAAGGFWARELAPPLRGQGGGAAQPKPAPKLAPDTAAARDPDWERPYPQYQPVGKVLQPCPDLKLGDLCPQDLSVYGGRGKTSFASVDDVKDFDEFCRQCTANKARVNEERRKYMGRRYHFTGAVTREATMTRGKPIPVGPVTRLPEGVASWEALAELSPAEVR